VRRAARRDANEPELLKLLPSLGAYWVKRGPFDGSVYCPRLWGKYACVDVEIKRPDKEGWASEYTPAQRQHLRRLGERGLSIFHWRTEADVMRDLGAKRAA
jgi:hypothetical protein